MTYFPILFYRFCNTPIETTPPIKTNKVLRTSAKLNNINNNTSGTSKKSSQPPEKRSARISNGKIVKKTKLDTESMTLDETVKFGSSNSENEQLPRETWLLAQTKPINAEESKVGVVLRSSGKISKSWIYRNSETISTPLKITTISKMKTPLLEPMTRILRSHKKKVNRRFKNAASRSWSVGMVTRSHRSVKC